MKLGVIKKILREDLARAGEIPAWVDPLLLTLNQFIDSVVTALQGRLSFSDNFSCKIVSQTFTSGALLSLNPQSRLKVLGALPVFFGGKTLTKFKIALNTNGNADVTLTFDEGGSAPCYLILLLG